MATTRKSFVESAWLQDLRRVYDGYVVRAAVAITCYVSASVFELAAIAFTTKFLGGLGLGQGPATGLLDRLMPFSLTSRSDVDALIMLVVAGLAATATRAIGEIVAVRGRYLLEGSLKRRMIGGYLATDMAKQTTLLSGESLTAIQHGTVECCNAYEAAITLASLTATLMIFVGFAFAVSPEGTAMSLSIGGLGGLAQMLVRSRLRRVAVSLEQLTVRLSNLLARLHSIAKFVRSSGETVTFGKNIDQTLNELVENRIRFDLIQKILGNSAQAMTVLTIGAFLGYNAFIGMQTAPQLMLLLGTFYRVAPRVLAIQQQSSWLTLLVPWYRRTTAMLLRLETDRVDLRPGLPLISTFVELELRNVTFTYPEANLPTIAGASLLVRHGEAIAIVGRSGAGKSTVLDLVSGLMRPSAGQVLVNGTDLREVDGEGWRRRLGIVTQDSATWDGTVSENIVWHDTKPDHDRVLRATRSAQALEFIEGMPQGFASLIGERGNNISGGQRQRLAMARALYRDAWVLIFDESTSALDFATEKAIIATLKALKGTVTIIVVSHRRETLDWVDAVYELEGGTLRPAAGTAKKVVS